LVSIAVTTICIAESKSAGIVAVGTAGKVLVGSGDDRVGVFGIDEVSIGIPIGVGNICSPGSRIR
jgi:hypothetical protein